MVWVVLPIMSETLCTPLVADNRNNKKIYMKVLTLAEVFKVFSDWFPVINERSFSVQVRRGSIRQGVMVEMVQPAVVGR
jgi:hypothetical protein